MEITIIERKTKVTLLLSPSISFYLFDATDFFILIPDRIGIGEVRVVRVVFATHLHHPARVHNDLHDIRSGREYDKLGRWFLICFLFHYCSNDIVHILNSSYFTTTFFDSIR